MPAPMTLEFRVRVGTISRHEGGELRAYNPGDHIWLTEVEAAKYGPAKVEQIGMWTAMAQAQAETGSSVSAAELASPPAPTLPGLGSGLEERQEEPPAGLTPPPPALNLRRFADEQTVADITSAIRSWTDIQMLRGLLAAERSSRRRSSVIGAIESHISSLEVAKAEEEARAAAVVSGLDSSTTATA